ncbi:MAG: replicative DNA helicase [Hyphomicrobiaceae bacterium]|nr:replicative DNA helicase [Hyphomicrobiaceae bacterium]
MTQRPLTQTEQLLSAASASEPLTFRQPPHNIEAEQALLGAVLINNESLDRVSGFLEPAHFFDPLHAAIYETAGKLILAGKTATPITLRSFFENAEPIDANLTVPQYLGRLAAAATTIINVADYGRTIYDLAVRRQLILVGEDLVNVAYDSPVDLPPAKQIEETEGRLYALAEHGKYGQGFQTFSSALAQAIDVANNARMRGDRLSGLPTGLIDLDAMMGGLQPSDLIVLAGRPSMGKTALATNIASRVASSKRLQHMQEDPEAASEPAVVGFFSLEMSAEQLAGRILSEEAEIPSHRIRRGQIDEDEMRRLILASQALSQAPLFIDQTGGISIAQLAARARKLKRQRGLDLLIVDYIQLLSGSSAKAAAGRVQEVTEITTGLKALAKELEVPVIALSQLSRQVESREDKRPQLSDLRESGSIEQDADVVLFVFREEYYVARAEPSVSDVQKHLEWQTKLESVRGIGEVIIGKQRHGPTGTVRLSFTGEFTRFDNLDRNHPLAGKTD